MFSLSQSLIHTVEYEVHFASQKAGEKNILETENEKKGLLEVSDWLTLFNSQLYHWDTQKGKMRKNNVWSQSYKRNLVLKKSELVLNSLTVHYLNLVILLYFYHLN